MPNPGLDPGEGGRVRGIDKDSFIFTPHLNPLPQGERKKWGITFALFFFFLFFLVSLPAQADTGRSFPEMRVALMTESSAIGKNDVLMAALDVQLEPGWKTYWRTPGDAGLPLTVDWTRSSNIKHIEILWPAPESFFFQGLHSIGYSGRVVFPLRAQLEKAAQRTDLNATFSMLVCKDICIPYTFDLSLSLPAGGPTPTPEATIIAKALKRVPGVSSSFWRASAEKDRVHTTLSLKRPSTAPRVFLEIPNVTVGPATLSLEKDGYDIKVSFHVSPPITSPTQGLFTLVDDSSHHLMSTPVNITPSSLPSSPAFFSILFIALIGGLILNVMPCVLPVLLLKLMTAVRHSGAERNHIRQGFIATAAGIIASFLLLSLMTIFLKKAGLAVGWGIQFQQPAFLIFLIVVLIFFAANLWELFTIPLPRIFADVVSSKYPHGSLWDHFLTGLLATLLATPCTAPFLGTAVSFALAGPTLAIPVIFLTLGLGMALPYVGVAAYPRCVRLLPRPGHWMQTVRHILGLTLLATAVWLMFILIQNTQPSSTTDTQWKKFDEASISQLVDQGQVVFVDVTADWCLTCQANKIFVLNKAPVADLLLQPSVTAMRADWTKPNDTIAAYLKKHGRFGIPFNIVYGPQAQEGIILPELLTKQRVIDALKEAGAPVPDM